MRVDTWECREDLSFICTARFEGLEAYADPRGEFYGPNAEEVGGVFERAGLIGAFGAER